MSGSKKLPEKFRDVVSAMPECSYGVNRVIVVLRDGTVYKDVYIAWAEDIIKIGSSNQIPFDPADIVEIKNL